MPEKASSIAESVDLGYLYLWGLTLFFTGVVYLILLVTVIKYRRRSGGEIPRPMAGSIRFEAAVSLLITVVFLTAFGVGAVVYLELYQVPRDTAFDIHVVGKQWMWQFQHPTGEREINELHVPINTRIKLIASTEDVIHSLFFPAFRNKSDVVPGHYTTMWFEATKEGTFPIFCAEYCGLNHSGMTGRVIVMKQTDYQDWLSGNRNQVSPIEAGRALFARFGCASCHGAAGEGGRCPTLTGVYGSQPRLQGGGAVVADEVYLRESIVQPQARIVAGYPDIMPTFQGQLNEEQLLQLVTFIKSLSPSRTNAIEATAPARQNNPDPGLPEGAARPGPLRSKPLSVMPSSGERPATSRGRRNRQDGRRRGHSNGS
jgi:cytochrome c oxidase subunit 2